MSLSRSAVGRIEYFESPKFGIASTSMGAPDSSRLKPKTTGFPIWSRRYVSAAREATWSPKLLGSSNWYCQSVIPYDDSVFARRMRRIGIVMSSAPSHWLATTYTSAPSFATSVSACVGNESVRMRFLFSLFRADKGSGSPSKRLEIGTLRFLGDLINGEYLNRKSVFAQITCERIGDRFIIGLIGIHDNEREIVHGNPLKSAGISIENI